MDRNMDVIKIAVVILLVYVVFNYLKSNEHLENTIVTSAVPGPVIVTANPMVPQGSTLTQTMTPTEIQNQANPLTLGNGSSAATVGGNTVAVSDGLQQPSDMSGIVGGAATLNTTDLMPNYDQANDFVKQNPVNPMLQNQNFLQAGYHVGISSVGQSRKNPSLDIRGQPAIMKQNNLSPWNNSSIDSTGAGGRYFELGSY